MTNVHFRMDGRLICVKKKRGGFKNISDKITSINQFSKLIEKSSPTFSFSPFLFSNNACVRAVIWGGSRGGSGGSVEPPKLNVKTYNKRVVKKSEPTQLINIYLLKMIFLCVFVRENSNKNKTNLCLVENGL